MHVKVKAIEIYRNLTADHLLLPHMSKLFENDKKNSGTSLPALFSA